MNDKHGLFKITQNVVLLNDKKEVLILKHKTGKWLLPGGRLNAGEKWIEGIKRELNEEAKIDDIKIVGIVKVDNWYSEGEDYYGVFFKGEVKNSFIAVSNEIIDYAWIQNSDDLKKYNFWFESLKDMIKKILTEQKITSKI